MLELSQSSRICVRLNVRCFSPQYIENLYEYEGFVFTGNRKRTKGKEVYPFPTIEDVISDLGAEYIAALDREALAKSCRANLRDAEGNLQFGWPLSKCIVWETDRDGSKYILCDGLWYRVDRDFYQEVESFYAERCHELGLPDCKREFVRESEYNAAVCSSVADSYLFDLGHATARDKHITAAKNETCDIFDAGEKRFIHVKPGKASADISHLLRQGVFSGKALKSDPAALRAFKEYLGEYGCAEVTITTPYLPSDYKIVFAMILEARQKRDIPFFSKVSFRDAAELTLEMMG